MKEHGNTENSMNYIDQVLSLLNKMMESFIIDNNLARWVAKEIGIVDDYEYFNVLHNIADMEENYSLTSEETEKVSTFNKLRDANLMYRECLYFNYFKIETYFGRDDKAYDKWMNHKGLSCTCCHPYLWSTVVKCVDFGSHIDSDGNITGYLLQCTECEGATWQPYAPDGLFIYDIPSVREISPDDPF